VGGVTDPRASRKWLEVRGRVLATARASNAPCSICGRLIAWDAEPRTPLAPSVDHGVALMHGGAAFDPANLKAAHFGCNAGKGNKGRPGRRRKGRPARRHVALPQRADPATQLGPPVARADPALWLGPPAVAS